MHPTLPQSNNLQTFPTSVSLDGREVTEPSGKDEERVT